jgi:hypothetical protein
MRVETDDPIYLCGVCFDAFEMGQNIFDVESHSLFPPTPRHDETMYESRFDAPWNRNGSDDNETIAEIYRETKKNAWDPGDFKYVPDEEDFE